MIFVVVDLCSTLNVFGGGLFSCSIQCRIAVLAIHMSIICNHFGDYGVNCWKVVSWPPDISSVSKLKESNQSHHVTSTHARKNYFQNYFYINYTMQYISQDHWIGGHYILEVFMMLCLQFWLARLIGGTTLYFCILMFTLSQMSFLTTTLEDQMNMKCICMGVYISSKCL